jgi:hypothetical protein
MYFTGTLLDGQNFSNECGNVNIYGYSFGWTENFGNECGNVSIMDVF